MSNVLDVRNLVKKFDDTVAVNGISFHVKKGEIVGILGPNGAGKTTTIQILISTLLPTSGEIYYFGQDFFTNRSNILQKITFASTYIRLPGRLSIEENLSIYAQLYGLATGERKKRIERFLKLFGIWDIRDREVGVLSAGQLTRVMLAKAFIPEPLLVLLDEPTAALDPDIALEIRSFIKQQQKERGLSVLLTSHNMDEVTEVCDRVLVLQHGKIIADNTPHQLATSVKSARVQLLISDDTSMQKAQRYLSEHNYIYAHEKNMMTIEIDEQNIASLLQTLAQLQISYDQISIDKPTLEDYFLTIAKTSRSMRR